MDLLKREKDESYIDYVEKVTDALTDSLISYSDWSKAVIGETIFQDETTRRCYKFMKRFLDCYEEEEYYNPSSERNAPNEIKRLEKAKEELYKERKKLQSVNIQAQEYYRTKGRAELIMEQVSEAVKSLEREVPIEGYKYTPKERKADTKRVGMLSVADAHYDSNFEIKGLNGEIVNAYNKDIFKSRMQELVEKVKADFDIFGYDRLLVVNLGDSLEGILRMSSLTKVKQPVVYSVIEFAEYIAEWLVCLRSTLEIPIEFATVPGNHTSQRYLGQKPIDERENLEYIIWAFIKERLRDTDILVHDYDDVFYTEIFGEKLMFAHGETKELETLMAHYENLYDIKIDACYGAHYHSESSKAVGVGTNGSKKVVRVPSLCGTDTYANKLCKNNRAGAYFAVFDEDGEWLNKVYFLT